MLFCAYIWKVQLYLDYSISFFNVYKKIINAFLFYKKYIKLGFFTLNKLEIEK